MSNKSNEQSILTSNIIDDNGLKIFWNNIKKYLEDKLNKSDFIDAELVVSSALNDLKSDILKLNKELGDLTNLINNDINNDSIIDKDVEDVWNEILNS